MSEKVFITLITLLGVIFLGIFGVVVVPPLVANPDVIGAFAAGFVNPYSSGYSIDVIITWNILAVWVLYESSNIKYGWVCLVIGVIPGVAAGLAGYLVLRTHQLKLQTDGSQSSKSATT